MLRLEKLLIPNREMADIARILLFVFIFRTLCLCIYQPDGGAAATLSFGQIRLVTKEALVAMFAPW